MRLSRGAENRNPGNIRRGTGVFKGEVRDGADPEFRVFETMAWGYRAMFLVIHNYDQLYGINTLDKIISRWSPPCENSTKEYIKYVALCVGLSMGSYINSLNEEVMIPFVAAMTKFELGCTVDLAEVNEGWQLFMAERN